MTTLAIADGGEYLDSGVITVGTDWTLIGVVDVSNHPACRLGVELAVEVAALTNLKVTRALLPDGTHVDLAVDADLNTATTEIQNILPANAYLATAFSTIQMMLNCDGVAEYGIYAKSGGTATVQMTGRVQRLNT